MVVRINPALYRPSEFFCRICHSKQGQEILGWQLKVGFEELLIMMVESDDKRVRDNSVRV